MPAPAYHRLTLLHLGMLIFASQFLTTVYAQPVPTRSATVNVNALVPATPPDYQAELQVSNPNERVSQNEVLTYTLTYGSHLSYATNIVLEMDWTLGSVAANVTPSLEIVTYVPNSASNAYNNIAPVIDLTQRKVTWTIPSFPGGLIDQTVRLQLRTIDDNTLINPVTFTVNGRLMGPGVTLPDSSIQRAYVFQQGTGPTSTPAPQPSTVATPTPAITQNTFQDVSIDTISTSSAGIQVRTSQPSTITINYGITPQALTQQITSLEQKTRHRLLLTGLKANTPYFFRLQSSDAQGKIIRSDIYTFTTASREQGIVIEPRSLIISNREVILHFSALQERVIVVPQNMPFSVQFKVTDPKAVKQMQVFLRNTNVLGITSLAVETSGYPSSGPMQMVKPGVYAGKVLEQTVGTYELYAKLADYNGNITEERLFTIRVVPPMTVSEAGTNRPVENAKVFLSIYNPLTHLFEPINQQATGISNPLYAQHTGIVPVVLPTNRYRVLVSATGYESKQIDFSLGETPDAVYPSVSLKKLPFSLVIFATYLQEVTMESIGMLQATASLFALSSRFSTLSALLIIACFIGLTLLSFSARTRVPLIHMPHFFSQHLQRGKNIRLRGTVQDENNKPVARARVVFFTDSIIIAQTITNRQGDFDCSVPEAESYDVEIIATGYMPLKRTIDDVSRPVDLPLTNKHHISFHETITHAAAWIMGWLFELLLFLSFLIEIAMALTWGIGRAAPFLLLTILNAILWVLYVYRHKR